MKILCVTQYYPPDVTAAAFRIGETVRLLAAAGHKVEVVTSTPHKTAGMVIANDASTFPIHRVPVSPIRGTGLLAYLEQYFGFAFRALFVAWRICWKQRPDVIWASSPPLFVGLVTMALRVFFRTPVVFDVRDLWPASAVDLGKIRQGSLFERLGLLLEGLIYRTSTGLTCVTESIAAHIKARTTSPVAVVYNGILEDNVAAAQALAPNPRCLCYAGNLGYAQGLESVIRAFARVVQMPGFSDCTFRLIGAGTVEADLKVLAVEQGVGDAVSFLGVLPKQDVYKELQGAGLLLIPLAKGKVLEDAIPSKLFDCMAVGVPIIATVKGEAAAMLAQSGGNVIVEAGNEAQLHAGLLHAFSHWDELAANAMKNVNLVRERYTREKATAVLEGMLLAAARTRK